MYSQTRLHHRTDCWDDSPDIHKTFEFLAISLHIESWNCCPENGLRPVGALKLGKDASVCNSKTILQLKSRYLQSLGTSHTHCPFATSPEILDLYADLSPTSTLAPYMSLLSVFYPYRPRNQSHYCGPLPRRRPAYLTDNSYCPTRLSAYHPCAKNFPKIQRRWWNSRLFNSIMFLHRPIRD